MSFNKRFVLGSKKKFANLLIEKAWIIFFAWKFSISFYRISYLWFFLETDSTDHGDQEKLSCPDFSQYLYFLFAPTLIYRDAYPRTTVIHWDYVLQMFAQVIAAIFYVYYVVVRFCVPTFANLNQNQITLPIFISVLFNSIMPGSLFLILGKRNFEIVKFRW